MKGKVRMVVSFVLVFMMSIGLFGCGMKRDVIEKEYLEALEAQKRVDEVYRKGVEEGRNVCRQEFMENLREEYKRLARIIEYNEFLRGGFIDPPMVVEVLNPMSVSADGKKVQMPHLEYMIVKDATFETRGFIERVMKQKKYVYVGVYFSEEAYEERRVEVVGVLKGKEGKYNIKKVPVIGKDGVVALIVETDDQGVVNELVKRGGIVL